VAAAVLGGAAVAPHRPLVRVPAEAPQPRPLQGHLDPALRVLPGTPLTYTPWPMAAHPPTLIRYLGLLQHSWIQSWLCQAPLCCRHARSCAASESSARQPSCHCQTLVLLQHKPACLRLPQQSAATCLEVAQRLGRWGHLQPTCTCDAAVAQIQELEPSKRQAIDMGPGIMGELHEV
jgi:hypothetical protein